MAVNIGQQDVTILFNAQALSRTVNVRHQSIRQTGIYSGGYLSIVDSSNCSISTLLCEITDGIYQVRIKTQATVSIAVASATPYVVLRWVYTGSSTNDFMTLTAVATPASNDVIVGLCSFTGGGALQGFDYTNRTTPNTLDLFLKVEPTVATELRVRIRAGRMQNGVATIQIPDQTSDLFIPPIVNSRVYLLYVNRSTGAIAIDSSGTQAVAPTAPNYAGKMVLAEITLAAGATNIVSANVVDTRDFANMFYQVDDSTIELNSLGKLAVKTGSQGQSAVVGGDSELTAPVSYELVTDMTINMTTTGGNVAVDFDTVINPTAGQQVFVRLYLDSGAIITSKVRFNPFGNYEDNATPLHMNWLFTGLAAGAHTFQAYWYGTGGTQKMNINGNETNRVLRAIELPHSV